MMVFSSDGPLRRYRTLRNDDFPSSRTNARPKDVLWSERSIDTPKPEQGGVRLQLDPISHMALICRGSITFKFPNRPKIRSPDTK